MNPESYLSGYFEKAYSLDELLRFVRRQSWGQAAEAEVPWTGVPIAKAASDLAAFLRRRELMGPELFAALRQDRPGRGAEVDSLYMAWRRAHGEVGGPHSSEPRQARKADSKGKSKPSPAKLLGVLGLIGAGLAFATRAELGRKRTILYACATPERLARACQGQNLPAEGSVEDLAQALYGKAGWSVEVVKSLFTFEQLRELARELELPSYSQKDDLVRAVMEKIG